MSAVDALAVVGVYLLGRSWLGFPVGLVAGLLLCVNPGMCYAVTKCGREPLLTLSIVYGCLGFLSAVRSNSVHSAILTGICFGLGGHVKETTAIVGVFIGAATILINRVYWRQTLIIVVSMALTMVPWVLRNSIHRGKLTGFSMPSLPVYNGSVDLGWIARQPPELQRRLDPRFAADPYDADQRLSQLIRIYSRAEPVQMAKSVAANLAFHWSPLPRHLTLNLSQCRGIDFISGGYYVVVFGLAACGAWRHRRQRFALAVVAVLVFVTFMHAPSGGFPRFRIPFEAGTALLAGALTVRRLERDTVS